MTERIVMIDEGSLFDTLATWEQHSRALRELPFETSLRPEMIAHAEQVIAKKRREN
jgi:hypothetical protein